MLFQSHVACLTLIMIHLLYTNNWVILYFHANIFQGELFFYGSTAHDVAKNGTIKKYLEEVTMIQKLKYDPKYYLRYIYLYI